MSLKQILKSRFTTYLNYDQLSDKRFHDPSDMNQKHHDNIHKDAERMADIAIKEFEKL